MEGKTEEDFNSMIQQRYQFPQMAGRLLLTYIGRGQKGNQNHPWDTQSAHQKESGICGPIRLPTGKKEH